MNTARPWLSRIPKLLGALRFSPSPVVVVAVLLAAVLVVLVITSRAYSFRVKWGTGELEMRPAAPVSATPATP